MILLRNMLFYPAFYGGTVVFVLLALALARVNPGGLKWAAEMWSSWHFWCVTSLLGIKVVETGHRPSGTVLFAIKHESFFEAIEMLHRFEFPAGFAKAELFAIPGWGRVAAGYGLIPVMRTQGAKALRAMLAAARPAIAAGRPLVIYPEGTRIAPGQRVPLQAGFAALYKLLGLPVVPVAVNSGHVYHRKLKRPGTITLHFGAMIEPGLPRDEIEARVVQAINCLNP